MGMSLFVVVVVVSSIFSRHGNRVSRGCEKTTAAKSQHRFYGWPSRIRFDVDVQKTAMTSGSRRLHCLRR